jgi:hypothetical protein
MANLTTSAGDNGVAGNAALPAAVVTGTLAADNFTDTTSGNTNALRHSVAKTSHGYGSAVAASEVFSETAGFRTAYSGVEADSPAVTRTA